MYLNTHFHFSLLEREVKARDLGIEDLLGHGLRGDRAVQGVTLDEHALAGAPPVRFQNVYGLEFKLL